MRSEKKAQKHRLRVCAATILLQKAYKTPPNTAKTAKKIKISHFLAKIFASIRKKQ